MSACCPHCSGTGGYAYEMRVTHHMIGLWGEEAQRGDSGHTSDGLAKCLNCGHKIRAATAEGRARKATTAATQQPKESTP